MSNLSEILFSKDLQSILGVGPRAATGWMHRFHRAGAPLLRLGGRLAIRRKDFERGLTAFEIPAPRRPRALPKIDPRFVEMLRPRPRRGRGR